VGRPSRTDAAHLSAASSRTYAVIGAELCRDSRHIICWYAHPLDGAFLACVDAVHWQRCAVHGDEHVISGASDPGTWT
jgi:hypothetical protein